MTAIACPACDERHARYAVRLREPLFIALAEELQQQRGRPFAPLPAPPRVADLLRPRETAAACVRGHAWTEANTIRVRDGSRRCRACKVAVQTAFRKRKREET